MNVVLIAVAAVVVWGRLAPTRSVRTAAEGEEEW